ncbi:MAG: GGDEF domain-containing protein [Micropepsaceae bacterium]
MRDLESPERILALSEQVLELMKRHAVPPSPHNYELWFAYATQRNEPLVQALNLAVKQGKAVDLDHARVLHARFFGQGSSEVYEDVGNQLNAEVLKLAEAFESAGADTATFGKVLRTAGDELAGHAPDITTIVQRMTAATRAVEARNKNLESQLQSSMKEVGNLRSRMETIRKESLSDALTGLANRRCFDVRMSEAAQEARSQAKPLCIVMGDVDHFKRFNDTFGHAIGDQVLRLVGQCFQSNVKGRDLAARYGGEEFVVILPDTSLANALTLADQIRKSVESKKIVKRSTGEDLGSVTLSLGVAEFAPNEDIADVINRADACLYAAKREGRNRVLTQRDILVSPKSGNPVNPPGTTTNVSAEEAPAANRSAASLSFEYAVRALCKADDMPRRSDIDLRHFHRFARWIAIAEPEMTRRRIDMKLVGSGFFEFFGRDLTHSDYLDIIEPDIRDTAYESAVELLRRPCGLWQETPVFVASMKMSMTFEYTVFPIFDETRNKRQLLIYVNHKYADGVSGYPTATQIRRASTWQWLELGKSETDGKARGAAV